ncbi:SpvB/TcaC N-terminal domain-containing protein [Nannocystaceae bacterium ST9]
MLLVLPTTGPRAEGPLGGPEPTITPTAEVGTLAGSFVVSESGAAKYTIPLELPAGTKGVAPSLAFAYDSAAGNGELGVGWSLAGQSAIGRCPTSLALDGVVSPIDFSGSDALCLDGERLVPITGSPWKPGTIYAKRHDDLSRVRLISSSHCVGEVAFEVRSADGMIHEYGCREDAVVHTPRGILRWALARSVDRFGNFMVYEYAFEDVDVWSPESEFEGTARVDHRLARVRYSGHEGGPTLAPDRVVELHWEARPDVARGWFAGAPTASTQRLREVVVSAGGELVRRWPLTYEVGDATGRSRLAAVTECAADGACKPATTFEWIEGELAIDNVPEGEWSADGAQIPYLDDLVWGASRIIYQVTLDADGDGLSDLLAAVGLPNLPPPEARGWELWRSQPEAVVGSQPCGGNPNEPDCSPGHYLLDEAPRSSPTPDAAYVDEGRVQSMFAIDYDGDGRDDAAAPANHYMSWLGTAGDWAIDDLMIVHGGSMNEVQVPLGDESAPVFSYLAADFTGDGLGDLFFCQPTGVDELKLEIGTWRVLANQPGVGFDVAAVVDSGLRCSSYDKLLLLDHDGDGVPSPLVVATWSDESQAEIPSAKWEGYRALVFPPTLDAFAWVETGLPVDLAQRWRWSPTFALNFDAFVLGTDFPRYGASLGIDRILDVQGDGLPDIVRYQLVVGDAGEQIEAIVPQLFAENPADEQGGLRLWINDGRRFRDAGWLTEGNFGRKRFEEFASGSTIDWNADGRLDLLVPNADTDRWDVWVSDGEGSFDRKALPGSPHWPDDSSSHERALAAMDVDGDALHDPVFWQFGGWWDIHRRRGEQPDRIAAIVDGLGQRTEIEYQSITDYELPDLHEPSECGWPASCAERPQIVVERHRLDTGLVNGWREFVHRYAGSRSDRLERRWLGFERHDVTEWGWTGSGSESLGQRTTWFGNAVYDKALASHPLARVPTTVLEQVRDPETGERHVVRIDLSHDVIPTSPASFRVVESFSRERTWQLAGCFGLFCELAEVAGLDPLIEQSHIVYTADELGFSLHERTTVELGESGSDSFDVKRTIEHDEDAWLIGLVTHETTTHLFGGDLASRTSTHAYHVTTGALVLDVDEPDLPELRLSIKYVHDAFGNVTSTTTSDAFGDSRTNAFGYDARGRFPITVTNALGHLTRMVWHDGLSLPHTAIDPNGIRQVLDVDGFGRTTGARVFAGNVPRGDDVAIEYLPPEGIGGLVIRSTVLGQGQRTVVYDRLARPTVEHWLGPDGLERFQRTRYDLLGRVESVTLPTFVDNAPEGLDTWTWDLRGRPVLHTRADGAFERWFYQGLDVEHRDFAGETTRSRHDGAGRLIETVRAPASVERERLCFDYGAFSTLVQVRPDCVAPGDDMLAPPGEAPPTIKRFEYDTLGRLVWSDDPSQGERLYVWNAFDELTETLDASDRLIEYEHDALGRPLVRIDDDGVTAWTWDTAKIGTISGASSPSGVVDAYQYDAFARPVALTQTIAGEPFALQLDYDGHNRVAAIHYPQAANLPEFAVRNLYGADGSLVGVRRLADDEPIWQIDEVDAAARITRESFTNGLTTARTWDDASGDLLGIRTTGPEIVQDLRYTWNPIGTLAKREDLRLAQWEAFGYDALHRLALVHTERGSEAHERHFAYDTLGNLVYGTDVGDYEYDTRGRLILAGSTSHDWDATGNLVHRVAPEGEHQFTWTSFDKPRRLIPSEGGPTLFDYDAEQRRVVRHDLEDRLETVYLLGFYERDQQTDDEGVTETHRYHVHGRERVVAEFEIAIHDNTVAQQTRYLHDDHQGSIDLVTGEQGEVVQRQSFDAWGKPRDPTDWTLPDEFMSPLVVNHGYTGHEGRRDAGLVNMDGRLYDPRLGRMVNADPTVVAPDVTLGWNRYAYVLDDPLSLVDPSGFEPVDYEHQETTDEDGNTTTNDYFGFGDSAIDVVRASAPDGAGGSSGTTTAAGGPGDAGPDADPRGDESTGRDVGLGLFDGVGNTGYIVGGGAATYVFGPLGVAAGIGYWATGGNPAGAARRFVGRLIGDDTLAADPSSVAYTASLLTGEIVSGSVAGLARSAGSGLRTAATEVAASCTRSCGRAGGGLFGRLMDTARRTSCFVAGTLVSTPEGPRAIEDLAPGDTVWAAEFVDGELVLVPRRVVEVFERTVTERLVLSYRTRDGRRGVLELTPEHPLYAADHGLYVWAKDLEPGSALVLDDGRLAWIERTEHERGEITVYNLEVEVSHNYFAGAPSEVGAMLVHNGKYVKTGEPPGPKKDPRAPHNAKIRSEAQRLKTEGNTIEAGGGAKERLVKTPGGKKSGRRPDIIYRTPDGQLRGRNVGRTNADGSPVTREVDALEDLNGPGKLPTDFVPYDR